jgi:outer membrane protein assembly factor BamB
MSAAQGGWKTQNGTSESFLNKDIIVIKNNLYLIDAVGNLYCIDALLGTNSWDIKNIGSSGLLRLNRKNEIFLATTKNKILTISPNLGKVVNEIELPSETKSADITDLQVIGDNTIIGFSDGWIYKINPKQKPEKIFRGSSAPIVSLTNVEGDCLVTDYDGNFTLLKISSSKK